MKQLNKNIACVGNEILVRKLNHPKVVSDFIYSINPLLQRGIKAFDVRLEQESTNTYFPNACTPMAGIMQYLKKIFGASFKFVNLNDSLLTLRQPLLPDTALCADLTYPQNKVWEFRNSDHVYTLTKAFIHEISLAVECHDGVLLGLEWCINEIMDNVIQHSGYDCGYIMGQIHKTTKHVAICIFDPGQGIFNSLKNTDAAPRTAPDAISLALKEGVTRDKKIGQGNGMWGLHNIIQANSGILNITSDTASYMFKGNGIQNFEKIPVIKRENGFTTVDFQIDTDKYISIGESLGGHVPTNFRIENIESEKGDFVVYKLSDVTGRVKMGHSGAGQNGPLF